jgi:hypothetical protein
MNYKGLKDTLFTCLNCETQFPFKGYSQNHKYCSITCSGHHYSKRTTERDQVLFQKGQLKSRKNIYKILIKENNKCSVCNIHEWNDKPIRLWVDHIDGNASNNHPTNFRLICPNCDSQSPTFGAKNKGNGRKSRGLPQYG